ncbi:MAG: FAD-dependent oxidoreductase [Pseudomonadota bacterium]
MNNPVSIEYPGAEYDAQWKAALEPTDYTNPTPKSRYHLAVIGAGPAGLISSIGAAGLGANVALIERHRMGGDCLNVGCVPSKCLLAYSAEHPGDFDGAFEHLRRVRASIAPHDSVDRYTEAGADVFLGDASFAADGSLRVGDTVINARRYAICTGAAAAVPPIPGLREARPLTNESIFELRARPARLAVLGGGPIGCELAQAFARLGVEVHLFEMADQVLALEPAAASIAVAEALTASGVTLHLGAGVQSVERAAEDGPVVVDNGETRIEADEVLVALGRRPNTDGLNLDAVGVKLSDRGLIEVDAKLRTANAKIYAAGDCAAQLQFTHHADAQARALIQNTLFAPTAKVDALVVPHSTYTSPEVSGVGQTPAQLDAAGVAFDTYRVRFDELDRGKAESDDVGFAEVWTASGTDKILGAVIVGHDAGEQLSPICLLMSNGLGLAAAGKTIFAYPTRSEYLKRLADAYNRTRFTPLAQSLAARWFRWRA